jgi:hypothetical protein
VIALHGDHASTHDNGRGQAIDDTHEEFASAVEHTEDGGHNGFDTQVLNAPAPEDGEGGGHPQAVPQSRDASLLYVYATTYETVQKNRLAQMNRIRCWLRDTLPEDQWGEVDFSDEKLSDRALYPTMPNDMREWVDEQRAFEASATRYLARELKRHRLWPWLDSVRGIGPILGGRLLARVEPLDRFPAPSNLWSYCGLDGPTWRRKTPEGKLTYSRRLNVLAFQIADSFQHQPMHSGGYRDIYDDRKLFERTKPPCGKAKCTEDRECCTDGHTNSKARRYAVKTFLKDLWVESRRQENHDG